MSCIRVDPGMSITGRRLSRRRFLAQLCAAGASMGLASCAGAGGVERDGAIGETGETGAEPVTAATPAVEVRAKDQQVTTPMPVQGKLRLENEMLVASLSEDSGALTVLDKRTGQMWAQRRVGYGGRVEQVESTGRAIRFTWRAMPSALDVQVEMLLEERAPELVLSFSAEGALSAPLAYPFPFVTQEGTYLVVPMNEGISYPVDDRSIDPMRLIAYGGHGICMSFFGATDGERGHMALLETADDVAIRIDRSDGTLYVAPEWEGQQGQFGYTRRVRYIFFAEGGHVAMCKRYRRHAQEQGRLKTLAEKRDENPQVDALIGAVNVWCWEQRPQSIAQQMRALGMQHVLWSECRDAADIRALNELGYLSSTYDIYQDVMDPANYPNLRYVHRRWPAEAWPDDLMIGPDGEWIKGWKIESKTFEQDGKWFPCGVVCDRQAPHYARQRIAQELETLPYTCRFIDTTTASPWRECYHPDHPLTRSQSREWKMELLRLVSEDYHLVTGTETGHDAAVPYVHYFEGMLSLGPYRIPDAGRDMARIWDEVPDRVRTFQVGHAYRLPLWELVYHDCVVAHWYWGDYNNKLPALWDVRDLFNVLYGTAPMFMFNRELWMREQERFVQSYRSVCPVARAVGYAEMTDHRFLTADRGVQQTAFAACQTPTGSVIVTANFGGEAYPLPDGQVVSPRGFHVAGLERAGA
jgi:hypothetical protein